MTDVPEILWPDPAINPKTAHPVVDQALFQGKVDASQAVIDRAWEGQKRDQDRQRAVDDKRDDHEYTDESRDSDEDVALRKAAWDAEYDRAKTIHDARVEVAKGSLDRAYNGAEFIRNAAAGILAIYQGVLAVRYAADKTVLPVAGLIPAVFLAIALASAAAYVAMIGRSRGVAAPKPDASLKVFQERRLNTFVDWVSEMVLDRVLYLHLAVFTLSIGAATLPMAFLTMDVPQTLITVVILLVLAAIGAWLSSGHRLALTSRK